MNAANQPIPTPVPPVTTDPPVLPPAPTQGTQTIADPRIVELERLRNEILKGQLQQQVAAGYTRDELRLQAALAVASSGNVYFNTPKSAVRYGSEFADEFLATMAVPAT